MLLGAGVLELSRLGLTAGSCIQGLLLQRKLEMLCIVCLQCKLWCYRQEPRFGYFRRPEVKDSVCISIHTRSSWINGRQTLF